MGAAAAATTDTTHAGEGERTITGDEAVTFESGNALPIGTRIGEFEIRGLVGEGGFGIVYKAYDHNLERQVALKEYLPSSLAARQADTTVKVKSARQEETFAAGLRSFVNEARLLAQFDHPSLVKVFRFWEEHGTAYMVMPLYEGETLKQAVRKRDSAPDEAWLRGILDPLLDALEVIHRSDCLHRDISPDNILLLADGRPVLLDFGAARRVIGDMTQALTVILKPGYAPIEQYDEVPHLKQGAWTDLYALAAVIHYAVRGKPPPAAVGRSIKDTYQPLAEALAGRYSARLLALIDRTLSPLPNQRPQSVAEFRQLLGPPPLGAAKHGPVAASSLVRSSRVLAGVIVAALIAIGIGYFLMRDRNTPSVETQVDTTPAVTPETREISKGEPSPITAARPPDLPMPLSETKQFDVLAILSGVLEARDRSHLVQAEPMQKSVRIGKDRVQFRVRSSEGGYLYVLVVGTKRDFTMLFPNKLDRNNKIAANQDVVVPRKGWSGIAEGPAGTNTFLVIVSSTPRDFSQAGLKSQDVFSEFDPVEAERVFRAANGSPTPFAGIARCLPSAASCAEHYGAALFTIEELAG